MNAEPIQFRHEEEDQKSENSVETQSRVVGQRLDLEPGLDLSEGASVVKESDRHNSFRRWVPMVVRLVTASAVLFGIVWAVRRAFNDPSLQELNWSEVSWSRLAIASVLYGIGTFPGWRYWHLVLYRFGQHPTWRESLRAFMVGQLGKYLPGKAMVVAMRAATVRSERTSVAAAAAAVFIETLTLMAVGSTVAASYLIFWALQDAQQLRSRLPLVGLALLLMLVSSVPTIPSLFRRLVRGLRVQKADPSIDRALEGLDGKLLAQGWLWNLIAWGFWGASLYSVLMALPGPQPQLTDLPLLTACVALAMVAGFLSLLPGGIGVRELVILTLLAPFGSAKAVLSAIVLRMAWLVSELLIATILYFAGNGESPNSPSDREDRPPMSFAERASGA